MASLLKKIPWIEWLCHTNFSFLTGASHPEDYIERANDLSYRGIGICDIDGVYGVVRAHRKINSLSSHLKLFIGCEIHLNSHHSLPITLRDTIALLPLNHRGYQNLCSIISKSHEKGKKTSFITLEQLSSMNTENLICLQPMRGLIRREIKFDHHYQILKNIFSDRFYIVLSRHLHPIEDHWIQLSQTWAKKNKVPTLLSQDPFFHHPQEKDLSDVIQAIRLNKTIHESVHHMFINDERSLHNLNEILARFQPLPSFRESLVNSLDLSEQISFSLSELQYNYPKEMIPDGYTSQTYLEHLVWDKFKLYDRASDSLKNILIKELQLIRILEFSDYFLTVWDIVRWAREQDILCQGRGSAANSAVCFMLGITSIDPSLFNLLFERFLSLERGDPPDIDVDFEHERREEVIQYIYRRYGRSKAAMVANVITFRSRGAIRAVGKALGLNDHILNKAAEAQNLLLYKKEQNKDKASDDHSIIEDHTWSLWTTMSERLKGFPRHLGLHSGGFIISQDPLDMIAPQEPASMQDRTVIQWAKDDIEALNLFKIDILALGMLSVLKKCIQLTNDYCDQDLRLSKIPQEDPDTYTMIQKAETVGTFQIESRAQMSMLPRLRPKTFYDLVVQVGIIRPGPIQGGLIHPYLKRRNGLEPIFYPHPKLEPILKRTLGVPIFQEQIMRIAIEVGDFTPGEADKLRKQIGSWSLTKNLGPLVKKLEVGMRRNGIKPVFVKQIIGHLQGFADYGFPESHAASFALLAYASSYFKCHYRDFFYVSLLNSQPVGFYSIHALVQSAKREGSHILPVSLNHSEWFSTIVKENNQLAIRLGFHLVCSLSKKGALALIQCRKQSDTWHDIYDYLKVNPLNRSDLTALVASNAFSDLGIPRSEALWIAEAAPFADMIEDDLNVSFPDETPFQKIESDFASFSTTLGEHPTSIIKKYHWHYPIDPKSIHTAIKIRTLRPNQTVYTFGMVLVRQRPMTAKGMIFFTIEDNTGLINLVFTPDKSHQYHDIINRQGFICVSGILQTANEGHSILVKKVYPVMSQPNVIDLNKIRDYVSQAKEIPSTKTLQEARNYM